MKKLSVVFLALLSVQYLWAIHVSGIVKGDKGVSLAFASVFIKGTSRGTTTNNQGQYFLDLEPGTYTIVVQYVGYIRQEKTIIIAAEPLELSFQLNLLQLSLQEVVVKSGGEDPAYEMIRNAIKKRKAYEIPLDSFTCEAYIKTLVKTRKLPKKILGQKVEYKDRSERGGDSAGKGVIYLSESLTKIAVTKKNQVKLEVLSGRESGSNGYGFNFPSFINFYSNNVNVLVRQLSPRGFISPIADGALGHYRYKYLGSFWEDGKEVNQIKVIPRRKYEPLFSGIINITEGDWRIHSLDLLLLREYQLELMDTLKIKQLQVPVAPGIWRTKDQVVYFTFNILGIDAVGNFVNVYNKYDLQPVFRKNYFNNVMIKYDTSVNKKMKVYWDSIRPIPLEPEEAMNYRIRDSVFQLKNDSGWSKKYSDSMRKSQRPVSLSKIVWSGFSRSNYHPEKPIRFTWESVIKKLEYNTAEGLVMNTGFSINRTYTKQHRSVSFSPNFRYGFSNRHLNAWASLQFSKKVFQWGENGSTGGRTTWTLVGGKRVSQFNQENSMSVLVSSCYVLFLRENYQKVYENYFGSITYAKRFDNDFRISVRILYENRLTLENTTNFSVLGNKSKLFTANYPVEKMNSNFKPHQALQLFVFLSYKPGQRFVEFPDSKVPIGSKYPTLQLEYHKGIASALGSDVNFDKWRFSIVNDINFKLKGLLKYRFSVGGFINTKHVYIQDYQHFNGNQMLWASEYLNSFQLAPYYSNSTTASLYGAAHAEHHFNGLLTNKIPLFRRLKWNLVAGVNGFYVNESNNYAEVFVGLENLFKVLRVDVVSGYINGKKGATGFRIGFGGLLGKAFR